MPIEDVDYMIQNSQPDAAVLFIDSAKRNKNFYSTPSDYVVDLPDPIRNVFGIEIIDAAIPAAMWNIDKHNNAFAYSLVFPQTGSSPTDFRKWFQEIQYNRYFDSLFTGEWTSYVLMCLDPASYELIRSNPQIVIEPDSHNGVFLRHAIPNTIHGITTSVFTSKEGTSDSTHYYFKYMMGTYSIPLADPLLDVIKNRDYYIHNDLTLVYYDMFYITEKSVEVAVGMQQVVGGTARKLFDMMMSNIYHEIERGNYDAKGVYQYLQSVVESIFSANFAKPLTLLTLAPDVTVNYGQIEKQSIMKWVMGNNFPFIFDMKKSTCRDILGFSTHSYENQSDLYTKLVHYDNDQLFMSNSVQNPLLTDASVTTAGEDGGIEPIVNILTPPGVINLTGVRYVLLRIPEIEEHMGGNITYGNNTNFPGIALFKLLTDNQISQLRFDFLSLIRKPFHPIGKVSRLTLRFELSDGTLYDFKGVDHNMTLQIKYYAQKPVPRQAVSMLNPNYTHDMLAYMAAQHEKLESYEVTEDEEDAYEPRRMLLEQNRFDYSSDDDDD